MRDGLTIDTYHGEAILSVLLPVAQLRMAVFRDYPYLYEGAMSYEIDYLTRYAQNPTSILGIAWKDGLAVGATTAQPLGCEMPSVQAPFQQVNLAVDAYLYLGESLVLPDFRGLGLGHAFFDLREKHAHDLGLIHTTFCAVDRPENHPLKPQNYRPNDTFWTKRGYKRQPHLTCQLAWQDIDQPQETSHSLTFWIK